MKRLLATVLSLGILNQSVAQVSETDVQTYIRHYNGPVSKSPLESIAKLRERLSADAGRYKLFFEGPDDQGGDSLPKEQWYQNQAKRARDAEDFLKKKMSEPAEAINIFTMELMRRYLDEPNSRPAIRELILAIQGMKFSKAMLNELEASNDARTSMVNGMIVGVSLVVAVCLLKLGACSQLALQQNKIDDARAAYRGIVPRRVLKFGRAAPLATETTIQKILRGLNLSYGYATPSAAETVGSAITKKAAFKRYAATNFNIRMHQLGLVATPGLIIGGGLTIVQKSRIAYQRGKHEYELMSPADLEQKYFGALAVLELTCQARAYVENSKADPNEVAEFIVDANEQVLLQGRMAGGIEVYDKTPLNFVSVADDGNSIDVDIRTHKDYVEQFNIPCPGAAQLSSPVTTSLGELERLLLTLLERFPEPSPTPSPAKARPSAQRSQVVKKPVSSEAATTMPSRP